MHIPDVVTHATCIEVCEVDCSGDMQLGSILSVTDHTTGSSSDQLDSVTTEASQFERNLDKADVLISDQLELYSVFPTSHNATNKDSILMKTIRDNVTKRILSPPSIFLIDDTMPHEIDPEYPSFRLDNTDLYSILLAEESFCDDIFEISQDLEKQLGISAYRDPTPTELKLHSKEFAVAKMAELQSWQHNKVFVPIALEEIPVENPNVITSRWLLKVKDDSQGDICKYKARLVVRGFLDKDKDVVEKDSPTVNKITLRLLIVYAITHSYKLHTVDIKTAFLQGKPYGSDTRLVYVQPPQDANELLSIPSDLIWKLVKPAYGLVDAPRSFYNSLREALIEIGFTVSLLDFSLFIFENEGILVCHVDDLMFAGSQRFCEEIVPKIFKRFSIGKIEENRFDYCGSTIRYADNLKPPRFSISQSHYATKIEIPVIPYGKHDDQILGPSDYQKYRTILGQLSWICISTRPDLSYITNFLSQNQNEPTIQHLKMLKRAAKQAKANCTRTIDYIALKNSPMIIGFSDANLNKSNDDTHISQTGICLFLAFFDGSSLKGNILDWSSTKQKKSDAKHTCFRDPCVERTC